jgi:penicillin-binding protein-related factor A (putative recombinase)
MIHDDLGKKAEAKIKEWLNRPSEGYCIDRIYDQLSGFYGSKNVSDFTFFKKPYFYYIESKATWHDRFDFNQISEYQYKSLLEKSQIDGVFGLVVVLFASQQRAFIFDIRNIDYLQKEMNQHSLNIKKIDSWDIKYFEIQTVPSKKALLDYIGDWSDDIISSLWKEGK